MEDVVHVRDNGAVGRFDDADAVQCGFLKSGQCRR